eukprot:TRINITY_DN15454_c0_g1_i1.p1 TRINITY_DN15454_c0_g1~~TRINITY_DN15454_c0_g1_i1.p1  ORF type:complete len:905 (+),score=142.67 TRINITY_DN15454_c0_g1_i1:159-2717(+)
MGCCLVLELVACASWIWAALDGQLDLSQVGAGSRTINLHFPQEKTKLERLSKLLQLIAWFFCAASMWRSRRLNAPAPRAWKFGHAVAICAMLNLAGDAVICMLRSSIFQKGTLPVAGLKYVTWWHWRRWQHESNQTAQKEPDVAALSPELRFQIQSRKESQKFERAYLVAEAFCLVAYIASEVYGATVTVYRGSLVRLELQQDHIGMLHLAIAPLAFLFRIHRCFPVGPTRVELRHDFVPLTTVFDTLVFSWYSFLAGRMARDIFFEAEGVQSSRAVMVGIYVVCMNNLLSYLLIFVFEFRRALVVIPFAFLGYAVATLYDATGNQEVLLLIAQLALSLISLFLSLVAKRLIEQSKWQAFMMLEEKTMQAVHEKVLRFQAEFQMEKAVDSKRLGHLCGHNAASEASSDLYGCIAPDRAPDVRDVSAKKNAAPATRRPPSLKSAPPLMGPAENAVLLQTAPRAENCEEGDCLPPESLCYVEGEAAPRCVSSLVEGDRVLCFDRLGGSLKHAAVESVEAKEGQVEWRTVSLQDGTTLVVTADHPLKTAPQAGSAWDVLDLTNESTRPLLRAEELQPGRDSLFVMKAVPVPVSSVTVEHRTSGRVSLSVRQPERHAIFVAAAEQQPGSVRMVAVESADAVASRISCGVHNTFLSVKATREERVARSAPASLRPPSPEPPVRMISFQSDAASSIPSSAKSLEGRGEEGDEVLLTARIAGPTPGGARTAWAGDAAEEASEGGQPEPTVAQPASLKRLLGTWALNLRSIGSSSHSNGKCRACAHESKAMYLGDPRRRCVNGALCNFCHEDHGNVRRQKRLEYREKKKQHKQRNQSGDIEAGETSDQRTSDDQTFTESS